jgi:hypothetical protein
MINEVVNGQWMMDNGRDLPLTIHHSPQYFLINKTQQLWIVEKP